MDSRWNSRTGVDRARDRHVFEASHRLLSIHEETFEKPLDETLIYILPVVNPDG